MFNVFVPTCAVDFYTTCEQNQTRKYDTEVFVHVVSLNGVVGLPSLFIGSLIGGTRKYDLSYRLMQNKYTLLKLSNVP